MPRLQSVASNITQSNIYAWCRISGITAQINLMNIYIALKSSSLITGAIFSYETNFDEQAWPVYLFCGNCCVKYIIMCGYIRFKLKRYE